MVGIFELGLNIAVYRPLHFAVEVAVLHRHRGFAIGIDHGIDSAAQQTLRKVRDKQFRAAIELWGHRNKRGSDQSDSHLGCPRNGLSTIDARAMPPSCTPGGWLREASKNAVDF